jgi:hypothetical protein
MEGESDGPAADEDIPALAAHLLNRAALRNGISVLPHLSPAAIVSVESGQLGGQRA